VFCTYLRINSDGFPIQNHLIGFTIETVFTERYGLGLLNKTDYVSFLKCCHTHKHTNTRTNRDMYIHQLCLLSVCFCGPGSSVGIATDYGLDGPGIESRWGRDFPPVQTGPGAHPASCTMGTGSFPGVNCGRGVLLTTRPLLAPRSWKSRAIPLPPSGPQPGL